MNSIFTSIIFGLFTIISTTALSDNATQIIDHDSIISRTHQTWEGQYRFSEEQVIKIENSQDLHVLVYRCEGHEGMLIDFAVLDKDNTLKILKSADTDIKGVTPALEGIDVLVGKEWSEILVRWKDPGQGGLRSIYKYRYSSQGIELIDQSSLIYRTKGNEWVSQKTLDFFSGKRIEQNPKPLESR